MQDDTALYGAKMMQPGMTTADSEENNLRPQHLEDYIGQEKVKQNLKIYLEAAKRRGEPMDHILLYGISYNFYSERLQKATNFVVFLY